MSFLLNIVHATELSKLGLVREGVVFSIKFCFCAICTKIVCARQFLSKSFAPTMLVSFNLSVIFRNWPCFIGFRMKLFERATVLARNPMRLPGEESSREAEFARIEESDRFSGRRKHLVQMRRLLLDLGPVQDRWMGVQREAFASVDLRFEWLVGTEHALFRLSL